MAPKFSAPPMTLGCVCSDEQTEVVTQDIDLADHLALVASRWDDEPNDPPAGGGHRPVSGSSTGPTLEEAQAQIRKVYEATVLLEQLESTGQLRGNGHHARQILAQRAADELRDRWQTPKAE